MLSGMLLIVWILFAMLLLLEWSCFSNCGYFPSLVCKEALLQLLFPQQNVTGV